MPKCLRCKTEKPTRYFQQKTRKPPSYDEVCKACRAHDQAEKREEEVDARAARRKALQDIAKEQEIARRNKARHAKRRLNDKMSKEQLAQREIARRVLAQRSLLRFIQRHNTKYEAGWVHRHICERLENFVREVEAGNDPRLMLFMPPRHGKSEIASNFFPAWVLGHHPDWHIIASSYGSSLPIIFSRRVRELVRDDSYKAVFKETRLDPNNENVEGWSTTQGGIYVPAGVGGGITGKGANIFLVDDPIKDTQEADSETIRNTLWDWYQGVAMTRLAPQSGIVVIQTRWHDDDLSGRLETLMSDSLAEVEAEFEENVELLGIEEANTLKAHALEEIDRWEIISYPAIAEQDEYIGEDGHIYNTPARGRTRVREKGDALHPERYPAKRLRRIYNAYRKGGNMRLWHALYQQTPVPDEGDFFRKSMFKIEDLPTKTPNMPSFDTWDLAIGTKQENDWTVGASGYIDYEGVLNVSLVQRGKWGDPETIADLILEQAVLQKSQMIGIERGQLELAVMPSLRRKKKEQRISVAFLDGKDALTPITDKRVRARPLQGLMQAGMVRFKKDAPWLEMVIAELLRFDKGKWDDIVDALAWLARVAQAQSVPTPPKSKQLKSWRDKLSATAGGTHRTPMAA